MIVEHLQKAEHGAGFIVSDLRAVQRHVGFANQLLVQLMIEQAENLQKFIGMVLVEAESDEGTQHCPTEWTRDDDATYDTLLLVSGHDVPREAISTWSDEQCQQAEAWAVAAHLYASDNHDVDVPPMPACVAAYPEVV